MKKPNEKNACIAFIEILCKITGVEYDKESSPDEQNRSSPDVDYILISKDGRSHRIAVEHTLVESFEDQLAYANQSYDVVEQINVQCKGQLPTDRYYFLVVPQPLIGTLKIKERNRFIKEMSSWIPNISQTLTQGRSASQVYNDSTVSLRCEGSHPEMNGNVHRIQRQPMGAEKLKRERFRRAINEKLPKLCRYKLKGVTTALLLEDINLSFLNPQERWRDLTIIQRSLTFILVDYMIILASNKNRMIVGKVWKEKGRLYSMIPDDRIFSLQY